MKLQALLLYCALGCYVLILGVELGRGLLADPTPPREGELAQLASGLGVDAEQISDVERGETPPGQAIPVLAYLDGLLLLVLAIMALSQVMPRLAGTATGPVTFVVSLLLVIGAIASAFGAFTKLMIMIGLFTAVPFGTIIYFALYGFFDVSGSSAVLSTLMFLKLAFCVLMLIAQPTIVSGNKSLVLFALSSMIANLIVGFLHSFPPAFLASITDAVAAIVVAIFAIIWAVIGLLASIPGVIKAFQSVGSAATPG